MSDDTSALDRRTVLQSIGAAGTATGFAATAGCLDAVFDEDDDQFVISMGEVADTADPNDHNATPDYNTLDPVYEPLFQVDEEGNIEEHVVTDWEQVDADTWELTIRDDVQFHNGDELTASDVAFTINRVVDEEIGPASPQVDGMIGVQEAEAIDETTVEVTHDVNPDLALQGLAVFARALNEDWVEDQDTDEDGSLTEDMNGTGPYQLEDFEPGEEFEYTVFEDYWGETPDIERIKFESVDDDGTRSSRLLSGETNFITNLLPTDVVDVQEDDDLRDEDIISYRNIFIAMPNDEPPFDSQEFRQAMNLAIDNQEIIDSINEGYGEPMSQPVPEGIFGHNPDLEPYEQDKEEADNLIEESGHVGEEIELVCPEGRYLNDTDIAEFVAEEIDDLENVSCDFDIIPFGDLTDMILDGDLETAPDFYLIGWGNPTHDANYGLEPWFVEGQASFSFQDAEIEQDILDSQTIEDTTERENKLQEIAEKIHDRAPWIFLHRQASIFGLDDDVEWSPRADERINPETMEQ